MTLIIIPIYTLSKTQCAVLRCHFFLLSPIFFIPLSSTFMFKTSSWIFFWYLKVKTDYAICLPTKISSRYWLLFQAFRHFQFLPLILSLKPQLPKWYNFCHLCFPTYYKAIFLAHIHIAHNINLSPSWLVLYFYIPLFVVEFQISYKVLVLWICS